MMRIGINILFLIPGVVGGTETYAAGLLSGLAKTDNENEFFIFLNQRAAAWPIPEKENFIKIICPFDGQKRYLRYFFEQYQLPQLLRQYRIDLIHSLGYVGPLRTPCISVVTIPDVNFIDVAHTLSILKKCTLRLFSLQSAKNSSHIITISQFSKGRLCRILRIPEKKITVTLLSADINNINRLNKSKDLSVYYRIKRPYIVAFGGGAIHKNIPRLLQAFASLKNSIPHSLVLIGHIPPNVELRTVFNDYDINERLIATGYVPRDHVGLLLSNSDLFVLPSLYEGFGIPLLEAQIAGVPIACSTAGSLPEVGGDGAFYFNPNSVESIAQAIWLCLQDAKLRSQLIIKGRENSQIFSWDKTARETIRVYHKVLHAKK